LEIIRSSWVVTLLILGALSGSSTIISTGHAAMTGLVCIASPDSTDCPESQPAFSGPNGTTFSVAVDIQNSDSLSGFDITVATKSSVLNPLSIDLNNTIIPSSIRFVVIDSTGSVNGVGFAHLALVGVGSHTVAPTTGTLFRINYRVLGGISNRTVIGFESIIVTGAGIPAVVLPEITQGALFTVQPPEPDFIMTGFPVALNFPRGSTGASNIEVSGLNGFLGSVNLRASTSDPGISAVLSENTVTLSDQSSVIINVAFSSAVSTTPGDYFVTVTGTNGSLSHSLDFVIAVSDFAISANPVNVTLLTGGPGDSTPPRTIPGFSKTFQISIASILGFNGKLLLSMVVSPGLKHGLTASLSSASLFVSGIAGQDALATLTVTATNNTPAGTYLMNVTASNGSLSHSIILAVFVSR
jgi:hypothetical protein